MNELLENTKGGKNMKYYDYKKEAMKARRKGYTTVKCAEGWKNKKY